MFPNLNENSNSLDRVRKNDLFVPSDYGGAIAEGIGCPYP